MRTSVPSTLPLFRSEMQVRLLGLLLLQPEREWTIEELRRALDAPASSIVRELSRAEDAGIVTRDSSARPHRLVAARSSPLFDPLRELLQRTVGVEDELRVALSTDGVDAAAIHGSWAHPPRSPDSDIDIVVIGDASLRELRRRVRGVGARAGRAVDVTLFGADEARARRARSDGFIAGLLEEPLIDLVGDVRAVIER
jgi:predicted nucleotidyltransferase